MTRIRQNGEEGGGKQLEPWPFDSLRLLRTFDANGVVRPVVSERGESNGEEGTPIELFLSGVAENAIIFSLPEVIAGDRSKEFS
jgi:hypothetical protein